MNLRIKMILLVVVPIVVMWVASLFILNYLGDIKMGQERAKVITLRYPGLLFCLV